MKPEAASGKKGKKGGPAKLHVKGVCVGKVLTASVTGAAASRRWPSSWTAASLDVDKKSPFKLRHAGPEPEASVVIASRPTSPSRAEAAPARSSPRTSPVAVRRTSRARARFVAAGGIAARRWACVRSRSWRLPGGCGRQRPSDGRRPGPASRTSAGTTYWAVLRGARDQHSLAARHPMRAVRRDSVGPRPPSSGRPRSTSPLKPQHRRRRSVPGSRSGCRRDRNGRVAPGCAERALGRARSVDRTRRLEISLAGRRARPVRGRPAIWRAPIGIGDGAARRPRSGRFYVRERLHLGGSGGATDFAFGTSAYSSRSATGPGGGVVGSARHQPAGAIPGRDLSRLRLGSEFATSGPAP